MVLKADVPNTELSLLKLVVPEGWAVKRLLVTLANPVSLDLAPDFAADSKDVVTTVDEVDEGAVDEGAEDPV